MGKRIVIMAGGTGGHVFPALAVAQELMDLGWQVSWLGTHRGMESRVIPENGIEIDWLSVEGVRGKNSLAKVVAVFKLLKACAEAFNVLKRRQPNLVLGMGGFVAGPGGLIAKILGIPLVIHEQNRVPGTTNRLLANRAKRVLEAFPGSFSREIRAVTTGNPLRRHFLDLPEKILWHEAAGRALRVLVIGGSQGAQILNQVVPLALAKLQHVQVKHQSGSAMYKKVKAAYQSLNVVAETVEFIDDIAGAYQWADLVICRAGAMTVSEVAAVGVPAVFVPLPYAIDDHQTANARYLSDAGAGELLPQNKLTEETLIKAVKKIMTDLPAISRIAKQQARLDATQLVVDHCIVEAA